MEMEKMEIYFFFLFLGFSHWQNSLYFAFHYFNRVVVLIEGNFVFLALRISRLI